ncbi:VOC family protein [Bacillus sp. APMAM]|nr:VOC family protein [Bacillus sp. APMAM]RTZ56797.1 VOC family protein [Bacillus sp. SAJ1]
MKISKLDHLVLTVRDIQHTCNFYENVIGMKVVTFGEGRKALQFGKQKINLHQIGKEFEPKAKHPTPGSADLCFISESPMEDILDQLAKNNITIIEGPVYRTGALGKIHSVYFRDPDQNLIEVSNYVEQLGD